MKQTFSIQFVSQITGINSHTIRAWEKRYQAITPSRDKNKRRLYTQDDIDRLKKIHDLCSLGNNVSDIAVLECNDLDELHVKYFSEQNIALNNPQQVEIEAIDINQTLQNLIMALTHYKLDIISHELEKAHGSLNPREFVLNLILPLLNEIGIQVASGHISVGMEHAINSIIKFHLGLVLFKRYQIKSNRDINVIIATPEYEFREIPALISAILCSFYNLQFAYLGCNMSAFSLKDTIDQIGAKLVLLSVSKSYCKQNKSYLNQFIQELTVDAKHQTWISGLQNNLAIQESRNLINIPSLQFLDNKLNNSTKELR